MASIIAIGLGLTGCGAGSQFWVGTWIGSRKLPNEAAIPEMYRTTLARIELTVRADGKFELVQAGIPSTGEAMLDSNEASLQVKTTFGKPVASQGDGAIKQNLPIKLVRQNDGSIVFTDPGGFLKDPVILKRRKNQP